MLKINKDFKPVPYEEVKHIEFDFTSAIEDMIKKRLEEIVKTGRRKGINIDIDFNESLKSENINLKEFNEALKIQQNSFFGDFGKYHK